MRVEEAQPLIKNWKEAERPREKLRDQGVENLSDVEIIATILGTGTRGRNSLDLSRKILEMANNNVADLAKLSIRSLKVVSGVGTAQACRIKAAFDLGRRAQFDAVPDNFKITTSQDAFRILRPDLADLPHEEFWVLFLNRGSKLILKRCLSQGGISGTVVDPRLVFKLAVEHCASSIIFAHNHPSGNLQPSQADIDLTRKLAAASKLLEIQVVDHLILAGKNYCSFADSGLL